MKGSGVGGVPTWKSGGGSGGRRRGCGGKRIGRCRGTLFFVGVGGVGGLEECQATQQQRDHH